jgi:hypothetical protein
VSHIDALWACTTCDLPRRGRPSPAASESLTDVVAELSFDKPSTVAELAAIERSCAWCFETHRVRLVRLFLARDRKRAVLVFRAPDAESVRLACRHAGMPFEWGWPL